MVSMTAIQGTDTLLKRPEGALMGLLMLIPLRSGSRRWLAGSTSSATTRPP